MRKRKRKEGRRVYIYHDGPLVGQQKFSVRRWPFFLLGGDEPGRGYVDFPVRARYVDGCLIILPPPGLLDTVKADHIDPVSWHCLFIRAKWSPRKTRALEAVENKIISLDGFWAGSLGFWAGILGVCFFIGVSPP